MKNLPCLLFLLSFLSCQINGQQSSAEQSVNELPTRRELSGELWELRSANIVYPADKQIFTEKNIATVKHLESKDERFKVKAISTNELSKIALKEQINILVGTPNSNQWIAQLLPTLPFEIEENKLVFGGQTFIDSSAVIKLSLYPNPINQQMPIQIITGFNDKAITDYLAHFVNQDEPLFNWSSWGYEIFQNNQRIIAGNFNDNDWSFDKKIHFDFSAQPDSMPATTHFEFVKQTDLNEAQAAIFRQQCEKNVAAIRAFINVQKDIPSIKYYLYRSAEEKGLMTGNTDQSTVQFEKNIVHTVLNDTYADNFIGKENELLLRQFLGEPKMLALERGLAIFFTEKWQRKGYQYWAKKLYDSENMLPLADILNEKKGSRSRYLNSCFSASFVAFLISKFGKEAFLKNYLTYEFSPQEITKLEKEWHTYLQNSQPITLNSQPTTRNSQKLPLLKGFNFAHEGYRIYNGYISREAAKAIDYEVSLGANANAIVPYSFMRDPRKPSDIPVAEFAGGENDESIVHAAQMSKNRGMTVVLKPQIWLSGSWPGEVEMNSEEAWQQWFNNYYEWILHYTMLAEIHEIEVLCVGTEFVQATLQRPEDWRKIVKKLRAFYSGKLTYAANWGDEFEKMTFWEDFDYIGLNCYYPLSKNDNPSDKELKAGFEEVIEKIERVYKKEKKPILFTEIGFRSVEKPWLNPHAEPDRPFNAEHQKRCFEVVFEGIKNQPWCQGILWWKFPSYLGHRGKGNTGFSPYGKEVEEIIKKYFK